MKTLGTESYVVGEAERAKKDAQKAWNRQNPKVQFSDHADRLAYALARCEINLAEATEGCDRTRISHEVETLKARIKALKSGSPQQIDVKKELPAHGGQYAPDKSSIARS